MTIQQQAVLEWYQKQYEDKKEHVRNDCKSDYFWENQTAEENLMNQLMYLMQLRMIIKGMEEAIGEK